jgi:ribonuclease HI
MVTRYDGMLATLDGMTITAAADGSALGNPGPAGWAWYVDDQTWAAGGWAHGTNNMGELKAVLELFRATAHVDDDLHILCDSQYVINSVTKWMPGWKKKGWRKGDGKPVMNLDLLQDIDDAIAGRRYRFEWVKGHVGHVLNEAADSRARAAAEAYQRGRQASGGPGYPGAAATQDGPAIASAMPSPSLFDFDEPGAPQQTVMPSRSVTVTFDDADYARLAQRAAAAGVPVEELLRRLA